MFNIPTESVEKIIKENSEDFKEFHKEKPRTVITVTQDNRFEIAEYDENGELVQYTKISPSGSVYKYNSHHKLIYYSNMKPFFEEWYKYDEQDRCVSIKNSSGYEETTIYNDDLNILYYENSLGYKETIKMDKNRDVIEYDNSVDNVFWRIYEQNERRDLIHYVDSTGAESRYSYDDSGNILHYKSNRGSNVLISGNELIDLRLEKITTGDRRDETDE